MLKKILLLLAVTLVCLNKINSTPLDDYVNTPDSHYSWRLIRTYQMTGYTLYVLNMTSQKWLDETIVANPIWWHYLSISVPDNITRTDASFVFIDGGHNTDGIPQPTDNLLEITSIFAATSGTIAGYLQQIPNQPTRFIKDPTGKQRSEDAVIAWTWKTFLENPNDPSILLRLPMTKAAVRAMDAVTEFAKQNNLANLSKFFIAGASKRGWTTWTTAAVDKRVVGAIPIVMDMLHLNDNLHVHYKSLGGWTFAFNDYYELNITTYVDSFSMFAMERVVDPATYLDRYKNIKFLVVTTAGDEFFLPEDTHAYWNDLVTATDGSVLLRRLPNAEHSCAGHEISLLFSMRSFFLNVYERQPLPNVTWSRANNATHGIINAVVDITNGQIPFEVKVYYAKTLDDKRKDFRLVANDPSTGKPAPHPVIWLNTKENLTLNKTSNAMMYRAAFLKPISGWFAFFIQFNFKGIENTVIPVTTESNVIPDTYPFEDCTRASCYGKLV